MSLLRETAPVSVVIPSYHSAGTIERAVSSVLNQTLPPRELVIVDDGSNDDGATRDTLTRQQHRATRATRIHVLSFTKNRGASAARNAGWNAATQPLLAWLDADDSWHPQKLELQTAWITARPRVALVGHRQPVQLSSEAPMPIDDRPVAKRIGPRRLLWSNRLPTSTVMLRRALGYRFSESLKRCEDHLLWSQIALDGHEVWHLDAALAAMHKPPLGRSGLSADRWAMRKGELLMYRQLHRQSRISAAELALLWPWSLAKHARGIVLRRA